MASLSTTTISSFEVDRNDRAGRANKGDAAAATRLRHTRISRRGRRIVERRPPNNQQFAELLRRRIEELDQRLAILNSERGRFEKLLDGVRE